MTLEDWLHNIAKRYGSVSRQCSGSEPRCTVPEREIIALLARAEKAEAKAARLAEAVNVLTAAIVPFAKIGDGIPHNWPGRCAIWFPQEGHLEYCAFGSGGCAPTITDYRMASHARAAVDAAGDLGGAA